MSKVGKWSALRTSKKSLVRNDTRRRKLPAAERDRQVCDLFAFDLRYEYRGFSERGYQGICDGLRSSLTDKTKNYSYALDIKEIMVSSDLAVVRLVWTLQVSKPHGPPLISREHGIDIFHKQSDGSWKIIRFIAYDEPSQ